MELARDCEALNRQRREICQAIEAEALALLEADGPQRPAFLLLAQSHWHHGVIGIVAARLVDRFALPVALLAGDGDGRLRASVRAPRGFAVDQALQACSDLLERHGGHPAAGGFTVRAECLSHLHERLDALARQWLEQRGPDQPVEPEVLLRLGRIDRGFWGQLRRLEPFGIGHPAPLFWSGDCLLVGSRILRGGHLQLELEQDGRRLRAMAWNWQGDSTLPERLDIAYRLRLDRWQGKERLQLDLVALRASGGDEVVLQRCERTYWCQRQGELLLIRNAAGEELRIALTQALGAIELDEEHPRLGHPYVRGLARDAAQALGLIA
jgi:single-stranded-DNA-specific exonuclease